jgi:ATP-dependent DNA helicase RecQ
VFGIGADIDEQGWRSIFRQLVALGLAQVAHDAHGALRLAPASRPVLRGEQAVQMRRAVARKRKVAPVRGMELGPVTGADLQLLEALKVWRRDEARVQGVPAYVILHDSTLLELARKRPGDLLQMNGINGIGAKRLERYGAALLRLLRSA